MLLRNTPLLHCSSSLRILLLLIVSLLSTTSQAYSPIDELPYGSRASMVIESLASNKVLESTPNREQFFPPASTLKLVTALAAKLELGNDFSFQTKLLRSGNNLVIQFDGDPTLTTQDLSNLLKLARQQLGNTIEGDLWLDVSVFNGYDRAIGWPWDILGVCYSAPSSAITLDGNCIQAAIYTQTNGTTRVNVPQHYPVYVTTEAKTVSKIERESTRCDLELIPSQDNHYQLSGCLQERSKPLPLKFAVQNPNLYAQRVISSLLSQLNIKLLGQIRIGTPNQQKSQQKMTQLATHQSAKLPELLDLMLKRSDNLIADNLTKTIGREFFHQAGNFTNGTEAIKQIILSNTGVNISHSKMVDGSGLSRNNRFTNKDMSAILRYIWRNDQTLQLIKLMPTAGTDGTLKYRSSMRKPPIKGEIIAKSGSLYGSYNMAGYGLNTNGQPSTLFVQYVADYHPEKRSDRPATVAPITAFETLFYQDIVRFSQAIPKK